MALYHISVDLFYQDKQQEQDQNKRGDRSKYFMHRMPLE
jgi:hypothetical protein